MMPDVNLPNRLRIFWCAFGCAAVVASATGCTGAGSTQSGPPGVVVSVTPVASPAPTTPGPATDGCPPDLNLLYERLKATPAIKDVLPESLSGLEEPKCHQGWAMARTVVKNADPAFVLFKLDTGTGRWNPVAAGTDAICDGFQVPPAVSEKLGVGC